MSKRKKIFLLIYIITFILCIIDFPYYIDAPGGLSRVGKNIIIEDAYKMDGSINLTYVSEYRGKLPLLLYAKLNKDWTIHKKSEDKIGTLDYETLRDREIVASKTSYDKSIVYAYNKANKKIDIIREKIYIFYIYEEAETDLKVGDEIISINDQELKYFDDYKKIIDNSEIGDKLKIKVLHNGKYYNKTATVKEYEGNKMVYVQVDIGYEYKSIPSIKVKHDNREMGPSGGLMISLYVYNSLVKKDITKGKVIVGTGTLDIDGNVGEIGGIEYKIKGAAKKKADIFFVPSGENYEDAMRLKKKYNYKMKIVEVKTFDDALNYLENNV